MSAFELYPAWKQAVKEIVDAGLAPGRILSSAELRKALRIPEPTTIEEYKDTQLQFVDGMVRVKEALLVEHFVDLETIHGIGYRVIEPSEQTRKAMRDAAKALTKALRQTGRRLVYLDKKALTADERRENDDAIAKLSRLQTFVGRPSRFLSLGKKP